MDFSPDGRAIVAGSSDQKLWMWDLATRTVRGSYPYPGVVHMVRYADPHTVVTLTEDGTTRAWPVPGPVVEDFGDTVYTLQFTQSGRTLVAATGSRDNAVHVLDVADSGLPVRVPAPIPPSGTSSRFSGKVALDADERLLAAGTNDGGVELWRVDGPLGPKTIRRVADTDTASDALVSGLEFRPHGSELAVSTYDGTVTLVSVADPEHPRQLASVREDDSTLNELRFSPDSALMATGSNDGHAYLYAVADPTRPRLLARLDVEDFANSVAFGPDGTTLAVSSSGKDNVQLWDIHRPEAPVRLGEPLDGPVSDIYQIAFNPARPELAAGTIDGTIWFWDLSNPSQPRRAGTVTSSAAVMSIAYRPDGMALAAGTRDAQVRLWRTDPQSAINWICAATGDHMTEAEWQQLVPRTEYTPAC